jgi:hypothetical protein
MLDRLLVVRIFGIEPVLPCVRGAHVHHAFATF